MNTKSLVRPLRVTAILAFALTCLVCHSFPSDFSVGNSTFVVNSGKIGIGSSNPAQALDVAGTLQSTGLKMTAAPQNGFVLTSDGSGVASWSQPYWVLVASAAVGTSSATTVSFSGLSIGASDQLLLVASGVMGLGTAYWRLFVNNDTNTSHYVTCANNTTSNQPKWSDSCSDSTAAVYIFLCDKGDSVISIGTMGITPTGKFYALAQGINFLEGGGCGTGIRWDANSLRYTGAVLSSITQIDIAAASASGIGNKSVFQLFKSQ